MTHLDRHCPTSKCRIWLSTLAFFFLSVQLFSQDALVVSQTTLFDTLASLSTNAIKISTDMDSLKANRLNDSEIKATFMASNAMGQVISLPVKVSVRSKSRRRYCSFPPLKLNFTKADLVAQGLARDDEYKIVTHCLDDREDQSHLLREFMVYQLYQIITPISHRAILVDIEYHCSKTDSTFTRKAILLESFEQLVNKYEGEECDCMGTPMDSIDRLQYEIVAMLQFMVGNDDMDHKVQRNVKLIRRKNQPWIPVAYDFDYACIVNAPYVYEKYDDNRAIRTKYLGHRENAEHLPEVRELFIAKKDEIWEYVKEFEGLEKADKRLCLKYIKDFYQSIENKSYQIPYKH